MAQEDLNYGTERNDGTGDPARTIFEKVNNMFTEIYNTFLSTTTQKYFIATATGCDSLPRLRTMDTLDIPRSTTISTETQRLGAGEYTFGYKIGSVVYGYVPPDSTGEWIFLDGTFPRMNKADYPDLYTAMGSIWSYNTTEFVLPILTITGGLGDYWIFAKENV